MNQMQNQSGNRTEFLFVFIQPGKAVKNKFLFTMTAYPGPNLDDAGPIVHRPMGLPITAGCDTAWNQTMVYNDASITAMQCLRPLSHSGAPGLKSHFSN